MTQTRVFSFLFSRALVTVVVAGALLVTGRAGAQGATEKPGAGTEAPKSPPVAAPSAAKPAPSAPPAAPPPAEPAPPAPPATAAPAPETAPPPPPTEEQVAQAKAALEQGQAAYKAGDYATAVGHFQQSNSLAPSAEAQYWLASSLDLQGNAPAAIAAFEALFGNPQHTQLPPEQIEPAKNRLQVLEQIPASLSLKVVPADVELHVDGVPQPGMSPFALKLPEGAHTLTLKREGFETLETQLEVKAAQSLENTIEMVPAEAPAAAAAAAPAEPTPAAAPAAAPAAEPPSKLPAYITLGVAGASAVVGTIFGIQALSAESDFEDDPTAANANDVERNALIADMAFGVAFTLGITGVVLLTSDEPGDTARRQTEAQGSLAIAPYASPDGAGAAARLQF